MARAVVIVCAALALLAIVLLLNTLRFTRGRGSVPPAPSVALDRAAAADRLAEAIRFETVSRQDPGSRDRQTFRDFHAFLARRFPGVHRALEREVVNGESLLYTWPGTERRAKPILLLAHQDVVPVEPGTESRWSQPPFSGRIADGYVWGRGAMDQKVSVLGILEAVESLVAQGVRPAHTVYLAFGHDEELGGTDGAAQIAALLKSRNVRLDYVLDEGLMIGEGLIPGVRPPIAMVGIAEKGRLTLELRATAQGGHASMPPPQTAIGVLAAAIAKLEAKPMPATVGGVAREFFAQLGPEMPFPRRLVFANLWLTDWLVKRTLAKSPPTNALIRTTGAATVVQGGTKDNVLPADARALVNFRILPGDSILAVLEYVRRTIDDPRISVTQVRGTEPSPVSKTSAASYQILATTIRQVFPDVVVAPGLSIARTDSEHYLGVADAAYRFLPIRVKPEDLARIHGTNERIAVDNYAEIVAFYAALLRNSAVEGGRS